MSYVALRAAAIRNTAYSDEGALIRDVATAIFGARERSVALFGARAAAIARIREIAQECTVPDWDGASALPVDPRSVETAESVIRALPDGFPVPDVAPEPDGALSLDWVESRRRMFSVSADRTDRLAFAWLDGTDSGHGVERFDGVTLPRRIAEGIRSILDVGATVRAA